MSWHHPDLYFSLCLLTGLAALLAIIYEFCRRKRRVYLKKEKPLDGLQRDRPRPTALSLQRRFTSGEVQRLEHHSHVMDEDESSRQASATEQFNRLCESSEDLPPKEQASRVREHFGIFGGARPVEGRGRKGKRP